MKDVSNSTRDTTAEIIPDKELVAHAQAGDRDAFQELVRRHQSKISRTARLLCNGHVEDGEDTFQNALLKAYLHLKEFRGESQFSTWLTRIVINECRMHHRKKHSRPHGQSLDNELGEEGNISPELVDSSDDPEEQCGREEFQAVLQRALATMGERYRLPFVLSKTEGFTYKELAGRLGLSVATAKTRLLRARRRLQRDLAARFCRGDRCYWPGAGSSGGSRIPSRASVRYGSLSV
jgi:RNA polymerase sigma-70 factor (ECF subfamily)